jgi:dihydrodipicolinate synthase/N-acetylneuraminate lyase
MVTPVTPDGSLDEAAVRRVVDHLIAGGNAGIFGLGTTGEAASVPHATRLRLIEVMVEQVAGRAMTYAGIGDNCLADSVDAAAAYFGAGADVVVAHLPSYYMLDAEEQYAYYIALADRIAGPMMVYNIPSTTHMSIPVEVVERLSHHPRIIGLKDSEGSAARMEAEMACLGGRDDFAVLAGSTALSAMALALGADGSVPSVANMTPVICQRLHEYGAAGDTAGAEKYQKLADEATDLYRAGRTLTQSLGALKAAMGALGLCGPDVLPPLRPLSPADRLAVQDAFHQWLAVHPDA